MPRGRAGLTLAALLLAAACSDPAEPRPAPPTLTLSASADSVMVGDTVQLTVRVEHVDSATVARSLVVRGLESMGVAHWVPGQRNTLEAWEPGVQGVVASLGDSLADTVRIVVRQRYTAQVSAAARTSCAIAATGVAYCWGDNQLTAGRGDETGPGSVSSVWPPPRFASIDGSANHACGLDFDGGTWCWGLNQQRQLGHFEDDSDFGVGPLRTAVPAPTRQVVAAYEHGCALQADGRTLCWGSGTYGATGSSVTSGMPTQAATGVALVRLGRGAWSQCGLDAAGRAWCWGRNDALQLGRATPSGTMLGGSGDSTARLAASTTAYRDIGSGAEVTCALAVAGWVDCWGNQPLGDGVPLATADSLPHRVALPAGRYVALAVGFAHACALDDAGAAWCWGRNESGELGDGTTTYRVTPVRVAGDVRFTTLSAGIRHSCGGATDGRVYCWGENEFGQVGSGDQANRDAPTRVVFQP